MSKLRDHFETLFDVGEGEIEGREPDQPGYVVFTRLRAGQPWRSAGWLRAADDDEAVYFAREHYGRDQKVVDVIAIHDGVLAGTDLPWDVPAGDEGDRRAFMVFTQKKAGDEYLGADAIEATSLSNALGAAAERAEQDASDDAPRPNAIWVVDAAHVLHRGEDDMLWRHLDQTYRLARGYTRDVRAKWTRFRDEDALREYRKSDLKKEF